MGVTVTDNKRTLNFAEPSDQDVAHEELGQVPGLKFMQTLWVSAAVGGPFKYTPTKPGKTELGLEEAHRNLRISPEEFYQLNSPFV